MKKLLLFISFISLPVLAQAQWQWLNPLPQGDGITDLFFISNTTGFATTNGGTILKSSNAGTSWEIQAKPADRSLNALFFANSLVGYACGDAGALVKTTDGGNTWTEKPLTILVEDFNDVFFLSPDTGFICADYGYLIGTTDGGNTWTRLAAKTTEDLKSIDFSTARDGYIATESEYIIMTVDGGKTWEEVSSGKNETFRFIDFIDINTGWIAGDYGAIYKTTDGGATWTDQSITSPHPYFEDGFFLNSTTGFLSAGNGQIWKTSDGGNEWTIFHTMGTNYMYGIWAFDPNSIVAGSSSGRLYQTIENGDEFVDRTTDEILPGITFYGSACFDENSLLLAGSNEGSIFRSADGGNNWSSVTKVIYRTIRDIQLLNATTALACADAGQIIKTIDKGASWTKKTTGTSKYLNALSSPDGNTVYACGQDGIILKSTDAGESWIPQTSGTTNYLYGIDFADATHGIAAGRSGKIIRTTDGGATWQSINSGTDRQLNSVKFLSADTVIASGYYTILFSSNGGASWTDKKMTGGIGIMWNILETASDTILTFGAADRINYSADRGVTWKKGEHVTGNEITTMMQTPSGLLFASGTNSMLIRKGKKSETSVEELIHADTENTLQLYPNPAKDKIYIQAADKELFVIYTATGKTFMSGRYNPSGIDITALPAGIYFLQLPEINKASEFIVKR